MTSDGHMFVPLSQEQQGSFVARERLEREGGGCQSNIEFIIPVISGIDLKYARYISNLLCWYNLQTLNQQFLFLTISWRHSPVCIPLGCCTWTQFSWKQSYLKLLVTMNKGKNEVKVQYNIVWKKYYSAATIWTQNSSVKITCEQ